MQIIDELKALNITQEKIAQSLGVSVSTVNRWLTKKFQPSKHLIPAIERFIKSKK